MFIRPILSLIISNQRRKKKRKILSSEHDNNKTQPINFFLPISLYFSGKNNSLLNYSNKLITPFFEIRKRLYLQYILLSFLCFKDTPFIQHKKRLYFHFPAFLFITHKLKPKYSSKTLSFSEKKKRWVRSTTMHRHQFRRLQLVHHRRILHFLEAQCGIQLNNSCNFTIASTQILLGVSIFHFFSPAFSIHSLCYKMEKKICLMSTEVRK